eukprot:13560913-Heterocapsa_arctica.AAC.1
MSLGMPVSFTVSLPPPARSWGRAACTRQARGPCRRPAGFVVVGPFRVGACRAAAPPAFSCRRPAVA